MHIRGEFYNYLEPSNNINNNNKDNNKVVVVENNEDDTYYSKLSNILVEMQSLTFEKDNQLVDQIVELASQHSYSSSSSAVEEVRTPSDISFSSDFPSSIIDDIHITMTILLLPRRKKEKR